MLDEKFIYNNTVIKIEPQVELEPDKPLDKVNTFYSLLQNKLDANTRSAEMRVSSSEFEFSCVNNVDVKNSYNTAGNIQLACYIPANENVNPNYTNLILFDKDIDADEDFKLMKILTDWIKSDDMLTYYYYEGGYDDGPTHVPNTNIKDYIQKYANYIKTLQANNYVESATNPAPETMCRWWNIGRINWGDDNAQVAQRLANFYAKQLNALIEYVITNDLCVADDKFVKLLSAMFAAGEARNVDIYDAKAESGGREKAVNYNFKAFNLYPYSNGALILPSLVNYVSRKTNPTLHALSCCGYVPKGTELYTSEEAYTVAKIRSDQSKLRPEEENLTDDQKYVMPDSVAMFEINKGMGDIGTVNYPFRKFVGTSRSQWKPYVLENSQVGAKDEILLEDRVFYDVNAEKPRFPSDANMILQYSDAKKTNGSKKEQYNYNESDYKQSEWRLGEVIPAHIYRETAGTGPDGKPIRNTTNKAGGSLTPEETEKDITSPQLVNIKVEDGMVKCVLLEKRKRNVKVPLSQYLEQTNVKVYQGKIDHGWKSSDSNFGGDGWPHKDRSCTFGATKACLDWYYYAWRDASLQGSTDYVAYLVHQTPKHDGIDGFSKDVFMDRFKVWLYCCECMNKDTDVYWYNGQPRSFTGNTVYEPGLGTHDNEKENVKWSDIIEWDFGNFGPENCVGLFVDTTATAGDFTGPVQAGRLAVAVPEGNTFYKNNGSTCHTFSDRKWSRTVCVNTVTSSSGMAGMNNGGFLFDAWGHEIRRQVFCNVNRSGWASWDQSGLWQNNAGWDHFRDKWSDQRKLDELKLNPRSYHPAYYCDVYGVEYKIKYYKPFAEWYRIVANYSSVPIPIMVPAAQYDKRDKVDKVITQSVADEFARIFQNVVRSMPMTLTKSVMTKNYYIFNINTFTYWMYVIRSKHGAQAILNGIRAYIKKRPALILLNKISFLMRPYAAKWFSGSLTDMTFLNLPLGPPLVYIPNTLLLDDKYCKTTYECYQDDKYSDYDSLSSNVNVIKTITSDLQSKNYLDQLFCEMISKARLEGVQVNNNTHFALLLPENGKSILDVISDSIVGVYGEYMKGNNIEIGVWGDETAIGYKEKVPKILFSFIPIHEDSQEDHASTLRSAYTYIDTVSIPIMSFHREPNSTWIELKIDTRTSSAEQPENNEGERTPNEEPPDLQEKIQELNEEDGITDEDNPAATGATSTTNEEEEEDSEGSADEPAEPESFKSRKLKSERFSNLRWKKFKRVKEAMGEDGESAETGESTQPEQTNPDEPIDENKTTTEEEEAVEEGAKVTQTGFQGKGQFPSRNVLYIYVSNPGIQDYTASLVGKKTNNKNDADANVLNGIANPMIDVYYRGLDAMYPSDCLRIRNLDKIKLE